MEHHLDAVHLKNRIHARADRGRLAGQRTAAHQRHNHAPAVAVKQRRLNHHHEWDEFLQRPFVAVYIELGHYSVECSSAKEPTAACTAFQSAAQASACRWRVNRVCCCWATYAASNSSMVAERLLV